MALPINSTPIYNLTVPSSGKHIKYRPFLIKDEKALLIAQQSEDPVVMIDSLKSVIKSCTQDQIDVNTLATFDLEYIFTQIRAKSVGEIIELNLLCDTCTDEKAVARVSLDLTTIKVEKDPNHTNKIELFDNVGITLKYPTMDLVKKLESADTNDIDQIFNIVLECIDCIYSDEEVFDAKDQTKQELLTFLNNLTSDQFKTIQQFFETMPQMKKEIHYTCPVCSKEHHKVLQGLSSFF
jgi:hypothetical protein